MCSALVALPQARAFAVYLVGSAVAQVRRPRDVDVLLCRREGHRTTVRKVRAALIAIRRLGLERFDTSFDPCFRTTRADELGGVLAPGRVLRTWKLEDPLLSLQCQLGLVACYRRLGGGLIVIVRRAEQYPFFHKLPVRPSKGDPAARWLEPGLLVSEIGKGWSSTKNRMAKRQALQRHFNC